LISQENELNLQTETTVPASRPTTAVQPPPLPVEAQPPATASTAVASAATTLSLKPAGMTAKRQLLTLGIAVLSDALSLVVEFVPPVQIVLDVLTAVVLWLAAGMRWSLILPLITEAIPGLAVLPAWTTVVLTLWPIQCLRSKR
jgi:hypothetical protein